MELKTQYLGLNLRNPLIAASSPLTASLDKICSMERAGFGAVVLKSVFEEQIMGEAAFLDKFHDYPEAADYLNHYVGQDYLNGHLRLIEDCKKSISIPVIASINCQSPGKWMDYAHRMESAGADAIELNVALLPTDPKTTSEFIEETYLSIIESVASVVKIPVSVKIGKNFTNIAGICRSMYYRNGRGVVLFNRFFEPDIDIDTITLKPSEGLSSNSELRDSIRQVGICSARLPLLDIAVSTGVHTGADVVKCILAGARAVELCSAVYLKGEGVVKEMEHFLTDWMISHGFNSVEDFRGLCNFRDADDELYQRVQYMKFFPKN